jgi:uncharacterized protein involved in exopolysaccharide biosynthesis/MinD-like ATPase involved in chromosome partitioning or flagellar assembly
MNSSQDVLATLRARKWTVLFGALAIWAVALLLVAQMDPKYRATATLLIETRPNLINDIENNPMAQSTAIPDMAVIRSEVAVLDSDDLKRRLITQLNLFPEEQHSSVGEALRQFFAPTAAVLRGWFLAGRALLGGSADEDTAAPALSPEEQRMARAIEDYNRRLSVFNDSRSNVIALTFTAPDPALAARIANAHVQMYIDDQNAAVGTTLSQMNTSIGTRLAQVRERLATSERALQDFRQQNGLMSAIQAPTLGAQIQDVATQLAQARADEQQRVARLDAARRGVETGRNYGANPDILNSPLVQRLREQEENLVRQQAEVDNRLGPNHPRVQEARVQLGATRAALRAEIERIARSGTDEVASAHSRVASLEQTLARLNQQGGQLDQTEGRLRQLELEVGANRRVYEALYARAQQASVQDTVQIPRSRVVAQAMAPNKPAFPNAPILAIASLFASILLSISIALVRELARRDYRNVIEAANHLHLAPLGVVPRLQRRTPRRLRAAFADRQAYAHALRTILTWTSVGVPEGRHRALLIASAESGEGKTELTINLARVLASTGYRVLVVDADLDRSSLSTALGIQAAAPGEHAMVLRSELGAATLVKAQPRLGFDVLRCMLDDPATSFALGPVIMRRVLTTLKEEYDLVLIDTSAITQSQDALVLGEFADAAIFVVRARKTTRRIARAALEMLRSAQVNVIGTVMTFANGRRSSRRTDTIEHLRTYPRLQGPAAEARSETQ